MSPDQRENVPPEWLDPESFPDDLRWIPAHYRLNPSDPVYLLLAWHWQRLQQSEDSLRTAALELRAALDGRIEALTAAAETVVGVNEALAGLQAAIEEKPAEISAHLQAELAGPVAKVVAQVQAVEKSLGAIAPAFHTSQRRQLLATLLIGVTLGVLLAVSVLVA